MSSEWQPIETAPQDGSTVLVWDGDEVQTARYHFGDWWTTGELSNDDGLSMSSLGLPTHWMPLPEPPRSELVYAAGNVAPNVGY